MKKLLSLLLLLTPAPVLGQGFGPSAGGFMPPTSPDADFTEVGVSTASLQVQLDDVSVDTTTLGSRLDDVALSTDTLSISTAANSTQLDTVAVDTTSLNTQLDVVAVDTTSLDTVKLNLAGGTMTGLLAGTSISMDTIQVDTITARSSSGILITDDGGNTGLFLEDGGQIGIGISAPDSILHIKANTPGTVGDNPAGQLIIQALGTNLNVNAVITGYNSNVSGNPNNQLWYAGSSASGNSNIIFLNRINALLQLGTNGSAKFTIDGAGDVGIGIESPGAKLDIAGNIKIADGTQAPDKVLTSDAAGLARWDTVSSAGLEDGAVTTVKLADGAVTTSKLIPDAIAGQLGVYTGNVGIGETNPTHKLHVTTAGDIAIFQSTSGNGRIAIDAPSGQNSGVKLREASVLKWQLINQGTDDTFKIQKEDFGTALAIKQDGNVGINNTSPEAMLDIVATNASSSGTVITAAVSQTADLFDVRDSGESSLFTISEDGIVTMPAQPCFSAFNSAGDSDQTGAGALATVDFDTEVFDQGGDFTADTFTAPVTGRYQLNAQVTLLNITAAADDVEIVIVTGNRSYSNFSQSTNDLDSTLVMQRSVIADMDASDTATVTIEVNGEATDVVDIAGSATLMRTSFSGCLVS